MAAGSLRIGTTAPVSVSLTETGSGTVTTLYSDSACTTPVAQPVAVSSVQTIYVPSAGTYTLSVKYGMTEIADSRNGTTRQIGFDSGETISLQYNPARDADPSGAFAPLGFPRTPGAFTTLMNTLTEGVESPGLVVLGDSTGYTSGKTRWPDLLAQWFAQKFPTYGVQTVVWGGTSYGAPTVNRAAPNGARYINGTGANCSAVHPGYGVKMSVGGVLDVRIKVALDSWSNGVISNLLYRSQLSTGVRCFSFGYKPGNLTFSLSPDGTSGASVSGQTTTGPTGLVDGVPVWFRMTINPNNGSAGADFTCYQSTDYNQATNTGTWTQVGTVVTKAYTAGSIYEGTNGVWDHEIIAQQNSVNALAGKVYAVQLIDVTTGLSLIPSTPDAFLGGSGTTPPTYGGSPMLTIVNGSVSGQGITYLSDPTRLPKMTLYEYNPQCVVLSCSHNDGTQRGAGYLTQWDTWLTALRTRLPTAGVAVSTQNPKTSPAINRIHSGRQRDLLVWASRNGLTVVDAYRAFVESSIPMASLVDQTDGVHPSDSTGSPLWAATVEAALMAHA